MHILGHTLPSERRRSSDCRVYRRIAADHPPSSSSSHSGFSAGVSELFCEGQKNAPACSLPLDQLAMQRKRLDGPHASGIKMFQSKSGIT